MPIVAGARHCDRRYTRTARLPRTASTRPNTCCKFSTSTLARAGSTCILSPPVSPFCSRLVGTVDSASVIVGMQYDFQKQRKTEDATLDRLDPCRSTSVRSCKLWGNFDSARKTPMTSTYSMRQMSDAYTLCQGSRLVRFLHYRRFTTSTLYMITERGIAGCT